MQIQLRQTEIVEALKQFVTKQGISLAGKKVDIAFTAGRKEAGISADISIKDAGALPDLQAEEDAINAAAPAAAKPALTVVASEAPKAEAKPADPPFVPDAKAPAADAAAAEEAPVQKTGTTSLFS